MIVILTGHGGKDKGSSAGGVNELDLNYPIAKNCYEIIKENTNDVIWLNKDKEKYIHVDTRAKMLKDLSKNHGKLDVYTIHNDWSEDSSVNGISVIVSIWNKEDKKVYNDFLYDYEKTFGIKARSVWKRYYPGSNNMDYYSIHRNSGEDSIVKIIECSFISNNHDRNIMLSSGDEIGLYIGKFILNKNNIKIKNKTIYYVQTGAFHIKNNALKLKSELKKKGFESIIKEG